MADKTPVPINFALGVDSKDDPFQIPLGKFAKLINIVFQTPKRTTKRNGYGLLTTISDALTLTTYSGNLVSIGSALKVFSNDSNTIINTGSIQPLDLSVLPLVRRATSQTTVDTAVASNGLACSVWLDSDGNSYYQINDSVTGGTIRPAVSITTGTDVSATMPRVFALGNYFVVTYLATVSSTHTLRYLAVPINNPLNTVGPTTIATTISSISAAYDGVVGPNILYLSWNASDGGGAIRLTQISATLVIGSVVVNAAVSATLLSLAYDFTLNNLWVTVYSAGGTIINCAAYSQSLAARPLNFTSTVAGVMLNNGLASAASNGAVRIFYEVSNFYGYDGALRTDYVASNTMNLAGTAGTPATIARGVGLGSKAVYISSLGKSYMLLVYGSAYQPTYFLSDQSGNVVGKLAYSNGGGYIVNQILPQINIAQSDPTSLQIGYLFKDLLQSIANPVGPVGANSGTNKTMGAANSLPVYTHNGINLSKFTFGAQVRTAETGGILHMGAGFPWMFDGVKPVEHQFHLWPDAVEVTSAATAGGMLAQTYFYQAIYYWTDGAGNPQYSAPSVPVSTIVTAGSGLTFTSVFSSGDTSLTVSSATGLFVGQILTDNTTGGNITAGTYITSIVGSVITISKPAAGSTGGAPGDTLKTVNQGTATVYIPTLRLTYKTSNKVVLKLYRWSTATQNFYEVTSVSSPTLNDPTVDYITFTDHQNDTAIISNSLLYTTGGVVEDIAAPAFQVTNLFDDRQWVIPSDNPYNLWFSKTVLPGTGVEWSDLLTYPVSESLGDKIPTGPPRCLFKMDTLQIVFFENALYYINGTGPDSNGNNSQYSPLTFISSSVGCSNQESIVMTDIGLMFQSNKGIWLLGRNLKTSYIGADVEEFNSSTVTSALAIPETTQVRFTLSNGMTLMYDYFVGQWGYFLNTPAESATLYQGLHTYLNPYGQIVQETPGKYVDISAPVLQGFTSGWLNLASLQGYQRIVDLYLLAEYKSPHILNVQLAYDYNPTIFQNSLIRPRNFSPSTPSPFGVPTPAGSPGSKEQWRIHAKRQLCESVQITMTEVFDPTLGTAPGEGLSISGFTARVVIKKSTRPIAGKNTVG